MLGIGRELKMYFNWKFIKSYCEVVVDVQDYISIYHIHKSHHINVLYFRLHHRIGIFAELTHQN